MQCGVSGFPSRASVRPTCAPGLKRPRVPDSRPPTLIVKRHRASHSHLREEITADTDEPSSTGREQGPPPRIHSGAMSTRSADAFNDGSWYVTDFTSDLHNYLQHLAVVAVFQATGALCSPHGKYDSVEVNKTAAMVTQLIRNVQKDPRFLPRDPWLKNHVAAVADASKPNWKDVCIVLFGSLDEFYQSSLFVGIFRSVERQGYRGRSFLALQLDGSLGAVHLGVEHLRQRSFGLLAQRETLPISNRHGCMLDLAKWVSSSWTEFMSTEGLDVSAQEVSVEGIEHEARRNPRKVCNQASPDLLTSLCEAIQDFLRSRKKRKPMPLQGLSGHSEIRKVVIDIASELRTKQDILLYLLQGPLHDVFNLQRTESGWVVTESSVSTVTSRNLSANTSQKQPSDYDLLCSPSVPDDVQLHFCLQHLASIVADQFLGCVCGPTAKHSDVAMKVMYSMVRKSLMNFDTNRAPSGQSGQHLSFVMKFLIERCLIWTVLLRSVFGEDLHDYDALRAFLNCSLFNDILYAEQQPGNVKMSVEIAVLAETTIDNHPDAIKAGKSSIVKVTRRHAAELLASRASDAIVAEDGSEINLSACIERGWAPLRVQDVCHKFAFDDSCRAGAKCTRSHDPEMARLWREENPDWCEENPDREVCRNWSQTGSCRFGKGCKYLHDEPSMTEHNDS